MRNSKCFNFYCSNGRGKKVKPSLLYMPPIDISALQSFTILPKSTEK